MGDNETEQPMVRAIAKEVVRAMSDTQNDYDAVDRVTEILSDYIIEPKKKTDAE